MDIILDRDDMVEALANFTKARLSTEHVIEGVTISSNKTATVHISRLDVDESLMEFEVHAAE